MKHAIVTAEGDKFIVTAGLTHVGAYREYCIAEEEANRYNNKLRGTNRRVFPRQTGLHPAAKGQREEDMIQHNGRA